MILSDEYLKEFTQDVDGNNEVYAVHEKCNEASPSNLNLFGVVQWAEKHKHSCPEYEVGNITASLGDQHVTVALDQLGRTVVQTWKGAELLTTATRRLIFSKEPEESSGCARCTRESWRTRTPMRGSPTRTGRADNDHR